MAYTSFIWRYYRQAKHVIQESSAILFRSIVNQCLLTCFQILEPFLGSGCQVLRRFSPSAKNPQVTDHALKKKEENDVKAEPGLSSKVV